MPPPPLVAPQPSGLSVLAAGTGVMLALVPPPAFVEALADPEGEAADEHHVTLFYLGQPEDVGEDGHNRLHSALLDFTAHSGYRGLTGSFGGFGVFPPSPGSDGKSVLIALWDIPGGAEFRTWLGFYLVRHRVRLRQEEHGWIPHQRSSTRTNRSGNSRNPPRDCPRVQSSARWCWPGTAIGNTIHLHELTTYVPSPYPGVVAAYRLRPRGLLAECTGISPDA